MESAQELVSRSKYYSYNISFWIFYYVYTLYIFTFLNFSLLREHSQFAHE